MVDLEKLKAENGRRWAAMKVTPARMAEITAVVKRLTSAEAQKRYLDVSKRTGVPANIIAVIHERESTQDWSTNLGQGDPWDRVSTHVPKGRGPFKSWEEAAYDALANCPPYLARETGWNDIGTALTNLERYNGTGYAGRGKPSPYVWAGTDQYVAGKYVADGQYDPGVVDRQLGCAALLHEMGGVIAAPPTVPELPTPAPLPAPAPANWLVRILTALWDILRGKQ